MPPCASTVTRPRRAKVSGSSAEDQPIVVRLPLLGDQLERAGCRRQPSAERSTSDGVKSRVRLPLPARNRAGVVAASSAGTEVTITCLSCRNVRVDLHAVGHEQLFVRRRVVPAHLARLLDETRPRSLSWLAQDAAPIGVDEVGGEVLDTVSYLRWRAWASSAAVAGCAVPGAEASIHEDERPGSRPAQARTVVP